jgi:FtsH-binding integral membrane protein
MSSRPPVDQQAWGVPGASARPLSGVDTRAIFGQTMFLVAVTSGFAAGGAYVGRNLSGVGTIFAFIAAFGLMFGMMGVRKARNGSLGMGLLFGFGLLLGVAVGPALESYAHAPNGATILWQAATLTGLFIAGFGCVGYAIKRDLAPFARIAMFGLLGLILVGFLAIFISIPSFARVWSIVGLAIFSVFTMYDFQRIHRAGEDDVIMLAMSIFLDVFNVFLFMLQLLGGGRR